MSELPCEEIAHRAGFSVSVGNWISPNGVLITGTNYESHHWETIQEYLGYEPETDNHLLWMNEQVDQGYIRMVFRADVLFHVGCKEKEELWEDAPNFNVMRIILGKLSDVEIHIFCRNFYLIGYAENILNKNFDKLQMKEL